MTGLFSDVYYEVERDAEFVLRERGSKFYAYVYGVRSEAEVKEKLEELEKQVYLNSINPNTFHLPIPRHPVQSCHDDQPLHFQ